MLSSVIVTREMLVADKACDPAMEAFDEAFPNGSATLQQIVEHPFCAPEWIGWLACNLNGLTPEIGLELIERSDDPAFWCGKAAAHAHWVTPEIGPDLIERSNRPAFWRGAAAAHAHWMAR